jgi:hypothetical protein
MTGQPEQEWQKTGQTEKDRINRAEQDIQKGHVEHDRQNMTGRTQAKQDT